MINDPRWLFKNILFLCLWVFWWVLECADLLFEFAIIFPYYSYNFSWFLALVAWWRADRLIWLPFSFVWVRSFSFVLFIGGRPFFCLSLLFFLVFIIIVSIFVCFRVKFVSVDFFSFISWVSLAIDRSFKASFFLGE